MMKTLTLPEYQEHLGVIVLEGQITAESRYNFISMIRNIIITSSLITRRDLNHRLETLFQPLGVDKQILRGKTKECLNLLSNLHEIVSLNRNGQHPILAANHPCWIKLADNNAVLLGNIFDKRFRFTPIDHYDVFRRFIPDETSTALLRENGVEEMTITDWLTSSLNRQYCEGLPMLCQETWRMAILRFYNEKKNQLRSLPSEPIPANIHAVFGKSGDYWGEYRSATGRWKRLSSQSPDGIWFGCISPNSGPTSWVLCEKEHETVKIVHLFDANQWRCLFLAKTIENEGDKYFVLEKDRIKFLIPIPGVLENLLALFASHQPHLGEWRYHECLPSATLFEK